MSAPVAAPEGRVHIAFNDPTLEWSPTWTRLDDTDHLVAGYTIDRGRQFELDRTDGGRAVVRINDTHGVLDPTNPSGPYYGTIEPLLQIALCRWNPVAEEWDWRFRGFVDTIDYRFDPSQRINFLEIGCVDIFEILAAIEMVPDGGAPPAFGDEPPAGSVGQVWFDTANMDARIVQALGNAGFTGGAVDWYVVFSGNVDLWETVYSPGENVMTVIQEAADAEFPGVSNVYPDRFGRLAVHGRLAKFDPVGVASGAAPGAWDFHEWQAGDGATVDATPAQFARIRRFAFNRGLGTIRNSALAYPQRVDPDGELVGDSDVSGQLSQDLPSIAQYGIRSWSAPNLLTRSGLLDASTALEETLRFASYITANYATAKNRITDIAFRSIHPDRAGASENWRLLSKVDISDTIEVTIGSPGGGGFTAEQCFVEGVHEEVRPSGSIWDDVTVTLDLSPRSLFEFWPFPTS